MSKEKKNQELSDEELKKASGGGLTPLGGGFQQATPESRMRAYTEQSQEPLGPPEVIEDPGPVSRSRINER